MSSVAIMPRSSSRAPPRRKRRDVWCFFDNDAKVRATRDALRLARLLDSDWEERQPWRTTASRNS